MTRYGMHNRRNREPASTWVFPAVVAAAAVICGSCGMKRAAPIVDSETLCPEEESLIPHIEVLLFERNRRRLDGPESDPLPPNTALEIRRQIEKRLQGLPKYALVEIYEVSYSKEKQFDPVARFCNPGDGSDTSELTGNPKLEKYRYQEMFSRPFEDVVEQLSSWDPNYRYSLVDSLGGVARLVLGNPKFERAAKSLMVVSDFVVPENFARSGEIPKSFAQVSPSMKLGDFEEFEKAGGARYDFRGASVRMILNRMTYDTIPDIQGPAHAVWWERFFHSQNAIVEEVVQVGE